MEKKRLRNGRQYGDYITPIAPTFDALVAQCVFATVVSWFSRYLVVNALFWGFCPDASGWLVFGRQFVIWVLLMVSPTPGGSGISEVIFATYYGDLVGSPQMALMMALAWRLISYYIYLVAGSLILPSYFGKRKCDRAAKPCLSIALNCYSRILRTTQIPNTDMFSSISNQCFAVIPARYASTRFPGKPLAMLGTCPVIEHVWRRVSKVLETM